MKLEEPPPCPEEIGNDRVLQGRMQGPGRGQGGACPSPKGSLTKWGLTGNLGPPTQQAWWGAGLAGQTFPSDGEIRGKIACTKTYVRPTMIGPHAMLRSTSGTPRQVHTQC